jgi:hypothetical protein
MYLGLDEHVNRRSGPRRDSRTNQESKGITGRKLLLQGDVGTVKPQRDGDHIRESVGHLSDEGRELVIGLARAAIRGVPAIWMGDLPHTSRE